MIPEDGLERVQQWAEDKIPEEQRDQIRIEIDIGERALTLLECRPPWREEYGPEWTRTAIARLRYTKKRVEWSLYWPDRHGNFHEYDHLEPSPDVHDLLEEIDRDPTAIFWG